MLVPKSVPLIPRLRRIIPLVLGFLVSPTVVFSSPEALFLVVNADSWSSLSIANAYVQFRGIPDSHVLALNWQHGVDWIDDRTFRDELLKPVFQAIRERQLTSQIRYVVYSSDFPTVVDFSARGRPGDQFPRGSLTGMTFLHAQLDDPTLDFTRFDSNDYAMTTAKKGESLGFESYLQIPGKNPKGLPDHLISTMLGYTAGRGNSYAEIIACLRNARIADGMHPKGEFCFMKNPDIRSTTRSERFPTIVTALQRSGARATVLDGTVPNGPRDVSGAMLGSSDFQWHPTARILPGAICDNLTSYGAIFAEKSQQTPISVFVRQGATGSSGTVVEPYAIPFKFPDANIHLHYVLGATLGEAFYLSVAGPYQLLILGDPLCRPYGSIPQVNLEGVSSDQVYAETVTIKPTCSSPAGHEVDDVRFYLDGKFVQTVRPGESFNLECKRYPSGDHLLSAVAYDKSSFRFCGRREVPLKIRSGEATVECKFIGKNEIRWGDRIPLQVEAQGCDRVEIRHFGQVLVTWRRGGPEADLQASELGLGPVQLQAVGILNREEVFVANLPPLNILSPKQIAAKPGGPLPVANLLPGLVLKGGAGVRQTIVETTPATWLEAAGIPADGTFSVEGLFRATEPDIYQFRAECQGNVILRVNGQNVYSGDAKSLRYGIPIHLARGNHEIMCQVRLKGTPRCRLEFDNQGSRTMSAYYFQHLP